jgi:DNA-binding NtrC family response regulator
MRREDIPHLVRHFLARFCAEENRHISAVTGEAMTHLSQLEWPGNIRQLENTVYRAVVMSENDQLGLSDFPQSAGVVSPPISEGHNEPLIMEPAHSATPAMISVDECRGSPAA